MFMDISKAFDSVKRNGIWKAFSKHKIRKNLTCNIKTVYKILTSIIEQ